MRAAAGNRLRRKGAGFTLLEVLIAFVLAALVLIAAARMLATSFDGTRNAEFESRALELAQSALALDTGFDGPQRLVETTTMPGGFTRVITLTPLLGLVRTSLLSEIRPYTIDIAVSWTTGDRERRVTLHALRIDARH